MYIYRYTTSASTKGIALLMLALVVCMAVVGRAFKIEGDIYVIVVW